MQLLKELMSKKPIKISLTILKVIAAIIMILFILIVYLQRFSNNKISFFDYRIFTVISRSMEPQYKVGDVLFAKEVKPSDVKIGDDISYLGRYGDVKDKIVTHRVVKISTDENGEYLFHAKGINNLIEDPIIKENQLYGKIVYKSIILSTIYKVIETNVGFYLCIIIPLLFIVGSEVVAFAIDREERKRSGIN